jgi:hypothetical protein
VDTTKAGEYQVVYKNRDVEKTAIITVVQNPNSPIENPDGSISFVGQEWDVIKDYGDGTKMIAMQDEIGKSNFNLNYFFNTNVDTLDGYQDSLVKLIVDDWYIDTIAGKDYEQFVQPVSLTNPTLGTIKGLSVGTGKEITNENWNLDLDVWNQEINAPSKYPTIVGRGEKQAFLMSSSDVIIDTEGKLSLAALTHRDKLFSKGIGWSWLRSPGTYGDNAVILRTHTDIVYNDGVEGMDSVVPSLVVRIPTCG